MSRFAFIFVYNKYTNTIKEALIMSMQIEITRKGNLYECECAHCGASNFWHEWVDEGASDDLWKQRCEQCYKQIGEKPEDVVKSPRQHYAGRYQMPGYLDATPWEYDTNKKRLEKTLKDFYGEGS